MGSRQILLRASQIRKTYRNGEILTEVLRGVDLDIYEGEFAVILGESGSGKTTLLNVLGGMTSPTDGKLEFMGRDLSHASRKELARYRKDDVGFVFQNYNLMPNLTAKENLDLIGEMVRDPMDSLHALEIVGLENERDLRPAQLSGGQQQRVSIARALVKKPKIIFADEPTASLDYSTSIEVLQALENVVEQGATLVMVTHNREIARMADRVVRMRDGRIGEVTANGSRARAGDLVW